MSRLSWGLVAFVGCFLLASSPVQACPGRWAHLTIFFETLDQTPPEAEVVAEVVLTDLLENWPGAAMAQVGRVLKTSDPRVRPGGKIPLKIIRTSCGPSPGNGDAGLISAQVVTDIEGRVMLCAFSRQERRDGDVLPLVAGECQPEQMDAAVWTKLAAERGQARAQYELGLMYEKGRNVGRSYERALRWFRSAAEGGEPEARKWLRAVEERGEAEALKLYLAAAESEEPQGLELFRTALESGDEKALTFFRLAAAGRDEQALAWFRWAAERGSAEVRYEIGLNFLRQRNGVEAVRCFKLAAAQGHVRAMTEVGRIYQRGGWDLRANKAAAVKWLALAASRGSREALAELKKMKR